MVIILILIVLALVAGTVFGVGAIVYGDIKNRRHR